MNIHWKNWFWSWNPNTLATWCKEVTYWKRPWCWERSKEGGEGDDRGWDGWMASTNWRTWVWASFRSWRWTGKPGVLQSMGSQRVRHDWATELNWTWKIYLLFSLDFHSLRPCNLWHCNNSTKSFVKYFLILFYYFITIILLFWYCILNIYFFKTFFRNQWMFPVTNKLDFRENILTKYSLHVNISHQIDLCILYRYIQLILQLVRILACNYMPSFTYKINIK